MPNKQMTIETRRRLQNALWGLFIGDALAMPAHWYYSVDNIRKVFDGGIRDYHALLGGSEPRRTISDYAQRVHPPQVTGDQLFEAYRDHHGPGNIPKRKMWEFHTLLVDTPYEVDRLVREDSETAVINHLFATACYPEHGLPLLLYFAKAHNLDVESALLANANAGGDNVHRAMVLGILVGAANKELPANLKQGLIAFDELQTEIEAFSDIALSGTAI